MRIIAISINIYIVLIARSNYLEVTIIDLNSKEIFECRDIGNLTAASFAPSNVVLIPD